MNSKDKSCGLPFQDSASMAPRQGEQSPNQESIRPSIRDRAVRRTGPARGGHSDHPPAKANKSRQQHKVSDEDDIGRLLKDKEAQQSFAIERYLQEGDHAEALLRQEREGYCQGGPGMRQYLRDWQTAWIDTCKRATR